MKEELPEVGDLAYVKVHPCCGADVGTFFIPTEKIKHRGQCPCLVCGQLFVFKSYTEFVWQANGIGWPREWCRKVPPLSELEEEKQQIEV